ncbi:GDSL-type esterase/lipase family protein [Flavobacterium selenitireducens]|uniref:GDSL-type esterase/lipase family protein n=1 Tax=Flavobacterium selenitireducens TaxID=2722704 RepID=UPI00168B30BF|nr:GDSL-type esterase/lipase family protein [Flavobacterium selenitireducens]MBD3582436.1 LysM peptidoglycan-binding domain-containing protein [Flavobacterium selenitireducens]
MRIRFIFILSLLSAWASAQEKDATAVVSDSVVELDTTEVAIPDNRFQNTNAIANFYKKLSELESSKNRKVNIVQIGDSHIQADLFSHRTRLDLQAKFGNGGRGFAFPHRLAGTNGSSDYKFSSNAKWSGWRNINSVNPDYPVGLSGIALITSASDFAIEFDAKVSDNEFNLIRVITPQNRPLFDIATAKKRIEMESQVPKKITHKIKNGEVLGSIADKYNLSISALKKANGLKSDRICAGKTLKIPTNEKQTRKIYRSEFVPLQMQENEVSHFYRSQTPLDEIYLIPAQGAFDVALNGIVLENNLPGVIYHSIGVNGAKFSDFNKYPSFFSELKALNPDLIILSLGTNESFDKMSGDAYVSQMDQFIASVRKENPEAEILVLTPPPSLFRRRYPNTFAADYAQRILDGADKKNYAAWDLYSQLGGLYGVGRNAKKGIIGGDRVHYTHEGYAKMGTLLSEAILKAYQDFKAAGK